MSEQIGRGLHQDFSGLQSGTVKIVSKLESPTGIRWAAECSQCGCRGMAFSNAEIQSGAQLRCKSSSCGKVSTETRRTAQFGFTPDPSVRNRAERRDEQKILKALEEEHAS